MTRNRRTRAAIAASAIVAGLAVPATADATTVSRPQTESGPAIQVSDDVGVQDNLTAFGDPSTTVIVDSASTPITAGPGCSAINATRIQCPGASLLIVALGAGDDTFTDNTSLQEAINGNDGNDTLNAGRGNGTVNGGLGNDTLRAFQFPS